MAKKKQSEPTREQKLEALLERAFKSVDLLYNGEIGVGGHRDVMNQIRKDLENV